MKFILICLFLSIINAKEFVLTEKENYQKIEISTRDSITVQLPTNPSTGYSWSIDYDEINIQLIEENIIDENNNQLPGSSKIAEFKFESVNGGVSQLVLEYRRPWEKNKQPLKKISYSIYVIPEEDL